MHYMPVEVQVYPSWILHSCKEKVSTEGSRKCSHKILKNFLQRGGLSNEVGQRCYTVRQKLNMFEISFDNLYHFKVTEIKIKMYHFGIMNSSSV